MTELVSLRSISNKSKIDLLNALGYDSDGTFIIDKKGKQVVDRYTEDPVRVDNMLILPGSTILLDDNPLSIALYLEEFGDVF
jgi:hypothetical protein